MRLQSLQEEERKKIAREIHDEFGQALTALKIDLSWINQRLSARQAQLREKIQKMSQLIDSTIFTIRRVATQLRPTILDDLGLAAATEWAVGEFQTRTEIKCNLVIDPEYISVDAARSTTIFRILQESLTNIARHAKTPTMVDISLRSINNEICLEVTDNGRGITLEEINDPRSLGLIGIRERVAAWGGTVDIHGKTGIGTAIIVYIPL
jgi:signal transduction histidine kinase